MSCQFVGKEFTFTQPDGTPFQVRGWGDQHYAVFESLDGYTLVPDPQTGIYQYATKKAAEDELVPCGARVDLFEPSKLDLEKGVRINGAVAKAKGKGVSRMMEGGRRCEERRRQYQNWIGASLLSDSPLAAPPDRTTTGTYSGLCLLIDFEDYPETIPRSEVNDFCNEMGYSGFGNNGSVYDYFNDNSMGKFLYRNVVTEYYRAKHPRAYYTDPKIEFGTRARQLIKEALDHLKSQGFDFSQLTVDGAGYLYALNIYYAGVCPNNWSEGLWPHSWSLQVPYDLGGGSVAFDYQFTDMGSELSLGTFCHENGHMICDYPDLYDYGRESNGVGTYCLMCAGNFDEKNPSQVSAYLKYVAGWASRIDHLTGQVQTTLTAGKNEFAIYRKNASEYFVLENRQRIGRDNSLHSSGLAIWHVDERGDNSNEQMSSDRHYELSLVQADNRYDLERAANQGDASDLYSAAVSSEFSETTSPSSRWWDGTPSGLRIYDIGASQEIMTFKASVV